MDPVTKNDNAAFDLDYDSSEDEDNGAVAAFNLNYDSSDEEDDGAVAVLDKYKNSKSGKLDFIKLDTLAEQHAMLDLMRNMEEKMNEHLKTAEECRAILCKLQEDYGHGAAANIAVPINGKTDNSSSVVSSTLPKLWREAVEACQRKMNESPAVATDMAIALGKIGPKHLSFPTIKQQYLPFLTQREKKRIRSAIAPATGNDSTTKKHRAA